MNAAEERIAQWEQMAKEAPDDMAFFSLGNAYKDAKRFEEAQGAYAKAIELNEGMSRAYQSRGQALIQLGREDEAAEVLTKGFTIAAGRRDVMPQRAMGSLLEKIGKPVPELATETITEAAPLEMGPGMVMDRRTGHPQPKLDGPPLRDKTGAFIAAHFGQITWNQWIGQGTKVINELALDFSRMDHQETYEQQMLEWLGVTADEINEWEAPIEASA